MDNKIFQITSRLYNFKIWKRRNRVRFFRYLSMRRKDREVTNIIEILQIMLGLNAYTISSGIFPKYLNGENIISVPLAENETMHIGYVLNENQELNELGKSYLEELWKYAPANP